MKKHIFLTGRIQVGKSTIIRKTLSEQKDLQDCELEYDGFITYFDVREKATRNLLMERITSDNKAEKRQSVMIHFENGRPQMETLAYETAGVEILESLDMKKLLIFDECGKFERNSSRFIGKIMQILDGETHVIGVLRKDDSIEWLQQIASREDVCLIEVTEENRTALKDEVKQLLLELLGVEQNDAGIT